MKTRNYFINIFQCQQIFYIRKNKLKVYVIISKEKFLSDSKFLCGLEQKLGGVIAIRYAAQEGVGDFLWSHSTNSMIIGYMNSNEQTPMV